MDSVIRGEEIVREAHYEAGDGSLTDPTNPRVTIRDSIGVAIVMTAIPVRISTGIYQYHFTPSLSANLGQWQDEWQGTISSVGYGPIIGAFTVLPVGAIVITPSMSYTYNPATDQGKVRLYINDTDVTSVDTALPLEQRSMFFTDAEIQVFLDMNNQSILRAAAAALSAEANNHQFFVQQREVGKTNINFGSLRNDLLKQAAALIDLDNSLPADGYAEVIYDDFGLRRTLLNTFERNSEP